LLLPHDAIIRSYLEAKDTRLDGSEVFYLVIFSLELVAHCLSSTHHVSV